MAHKRKAFYQRRKSKGFTQEMLAKSVGKSTVYIRMIENGTFTPGRDTMFNLATHLDSTVEELFPDFFEKIQANHSLEAII